MSTLNIFGVGVMHIWTHSFKQAPPCTALHQTLCETQTKTASKPVHAQVQRDSRPNWGKIRSWDLRELVTPTNNRMREGVRKWKPRKENLFTQGGSVMPPCWGYVVLVSWTLPGSLLGPLLGLRRTIHGQDRWGSIGSIDEEFMTLALSRPLWAWILSPIK